MPSAIFPCPHCGADRIGFNIVAQHYATIKRGEETHRFNTLAICTGCEAGLVVEYLNHGRARKNSPLECPGDPQSLEWHAAFVYPEPQPTRLPSHLNDQMKRYFEQAANALKRQDWDASGAMCRKVVDVSTKQLLGTDESKNKDIKDRINALHAKGSITLDLKDWCHHIRMGGNEAAHDEKPYSESEARELLDFVDLYLTYVYTLPGRLKERRERAAAEKKQGQPT